MNSVHGRSDRKLIELNDLHQPVGPTEAVVKEFSSFLGTLARNGTLCPLDVEDWRKMDGKEAIWEYTKSKYQIPESGKKWALLAVQNAWRRYKNQLKKKHYDAYETDELRMQSIPEDVQEPQFKGLLKYWNSEKLQKMSRTNAENRKKLKYPHTVGKTSFALVRQEKQKETSDPLSSKDLFIATRTRKPGRSYKCLEEDTTNKIAEMEVIETQQSGEEGSVNAFATVMGPEHPGLMRLYGRGVTKTTLKGKVGVFEPSLNPTDDQLDDKIQMIVDERLAVERKIMEDNLAEQKRMMDEQFEEQQEASRKLFIAQFLVELQLSGAKFDANTILARMGSPGEASSAQRAAVQPIHRLSTGSKGGKKLISGNPVGDEEGSGDEDFDHT